MNLCHEMVKVVGGNASHDLSQGTGTNLSAAIDTLGFNEALVILYPGIFAATSTLDVTVTECDTSGGTYAAITGAVFAQLIDSTDASQPYVGRIHLKGRKRYLKISSVVGTAAGDSAIVVVLGDPQNAPTTPSQTLSFNLDPA